jgi:beta-lactamase regulating signal transducer with metallopeptidase domain
VNALLSFTSIMLVTLGGCLTLSMLRHFGDWPQRRKMQCFVLASPLVSLGIGISGLCLRGSAPWDSLPGVALPLTMVIVTLGAVGLGVVRLGFMARVMTRSGRIVDAELQALTDTLAKQLGSDRPRLLLYPYDRPLAFTCGLRKPVILLSTWMIEHLDQRELEAVLAHELEHIARHDFLVTWLATILRDAFFYLPTSWIAYRQIQQEKELACDDLVIGVTHRPLSLASALTKVWLHALDGASSVQFSTAQSLVGAANTINCRIERLLTATELLKEKHCSQILTMRMNISVLVMFLLPGTVNIAIMLVLMDCGPALLLGKLL